RRRAGRGGARRRTCRPDRRPPTVTDLFDRPAVQGEQQPARSSRAEQRARRAAKKRRQRRRRRALVVLLVSVLVVGGAGYLLLNNASSLFGFANPLEAKDFEGPGTDPVDVVIEPGPTGRDMGAEPTAARLVANDSRVETKITIPEGFTVKQVLERASSVTGIPVAEFETAMADTAATGLPAEANGNYEGWLYPTTYVLEPGDVSAQGVIRNMVSQTVMKLDELGVAPADRESVLNKASLIEREAKYAPDRPKMARAIENRLATDMALQIDAAVAYGLDKPGTALPRDDTRNPDNPYNTYVHKGLPPTPIASPGADSLAAVVNPEPGDWIFWTAVNLETGETKFAVTWDE